MTSPKKSQHGKVSLRQFLHPKTGHTPAECEDAIAYNLGNNRFAIADGATEAFDARNWADQLVVSWVLREDALSSAEFWDFITEQGLILSASWSKLRLPWYSEEKARAGSFAAFIGIEIDIDAGSWQAIALGDSCLIQLRNCQVINSLPIAASTEFNSTPILAPSNTYLQSEAALQILSKRGDLENGDKFLLLSDAVAAWFFRIFEKNELDLLRQFASLLDSDDEVTLVNFFETERSAQRLKDDDIAVLGIEVSRI